MDMLNQVKKAIENKQISTTQSQQSSTDQLKDLVQIANLLGLYDASDLVQEAFLKSKKK